MCSFDHPAVPTQAVFAFDAFAGNARCNAALAQITSTSSIVVGFSTEKQQASEVNRINLAISAASLSSVIRICGFILFLKP